MTDFQLQIEFFCVEFVQDMDAEPEYLESERIPRTLVASPTYQMRGHGK